MLVDAPEIICTAMYVEHHATERFVVFLPLVCIRAHLDPLSLQRALWSSPVPPFPPANLTDAIRPQLSLNQLCCSAEVLVGYGDAFQLDPLWVRDPLRCESLDLFDGVMGGILEERSNQVQSLVVREMRGRLLLQVLFVEVLQGRLELANSTSRAENKGNNMLKSWRLDVIDVRPVATYMCK